ncbi:MAG: RDD family protein, partial [Actinomycetota bacterium]
MRRLAAWVIDVAIVVTLVFAGSVLVRASVGPAVRFSSDSAAVDASRVALNALVGTGLSGTYFVGSWVALGASLGQLALGLAVRNEANGAKLALGRAIARWILLFPPLGTLGALTPDLPGIGAFLWASLLPWYAALFLTTAASAKKQGW